MTGWFSCVWSRRPNGTILARCRGRGVASLAPRTSFTAARSRPMQCGGLCDGLGLLLIAPPELVALNIEDQLRQLLSELRVHTYELDGDPVELGQVHSFLFDLA
jgi:hypothetical protein